MLLGNAHHQPQVGLGEVVFGAVGFLFHLVQVFPEFGFKTAETFDKIGVFHQFGNIRGGGFFPDNIQQFRRQQSAVNRKAHQLLLDLRRFHIGFLDDGGHQFLVDDAVDAGAQFFIGDDIAEFCLRRQFQIFLDIDDNVSCLTDLPEHGQQYLGGGSIFPLLFQFAFDFRDTFAFFDPAGQRFLITRGEQRHPPDFVEVKTNRVVPDFLVLVFQHFGLRFHL